jgi:hypothetical protein
MAEALDGGKVTLMAARKHRENSRQERKEPSEACHQ